VIRAAGTPEQRVWRSSLSRVAADTAGEKLSPCVIVVGQVAGAALLEPTSPAGAAPNSIDGGGGGDAGV
jgi:siroheme synthase